MAKSGKNRIETKKYVARRELERRQNRNLVLGASAVVGLVLLVILYGVLSSLVFQPRRAVAKVNDESISVKQYQSEVRFQRYQLVSQYNSIAEFAASIEDEDTRAYFTSNLTQIQNQLNSFLLSDEVINQMIDSRLIRQGAEDLGIVISEAEVTQLLQSQLGYYPDGTPTPEPTLAPQMTSTLSPQQLTLITPTATSTSTLQITEEPEIQPSDAITTDLALDPTPTATPYTEDAYQANLQSVLTNFSPLGLDEQFLRDTLEFELYRSKLIEVIAADVKPEDDQVWARHILVTTAEEAQDVMDRLAAGDDFGVIASEVSTDPGSAASGGDLGWFGRNVMTPLFEEAAFDLEIGEISEPIETDFGFHIIQVLGHEVRPIDSATYEQLKEQALADWLALAREEAEIEISDILQEVTPSDPDITS